ARGLPAAAARALLEAVAARPGLDQVRLGLRHRLDRRFGALHLAVLVDGDVGGLGQQRHHVADVDRAGVGGLYRDLRPDDRALGPGGRLLRAALGLVGPVTLTLQLRLGLLLELVEPRGLLPELVVVRVLLLGAAEPGRHDPVDVGLGESRLLALPLTLVVVVLAFGALGLAFSGSAHDFSSVARRHAGRFRAGRGAPR